MKWWTKLVRLLRPTTEVHYHGNMSPEQLKEAEKMFDRMETMFDRMEKMFKEKK